VSGRMGVRGVYRFSSLVKQNKKARNYAVFCFAGIFFFNFLCYEVIVKQNIYKRSTDHYFCLLLSPSLTHMHHTLVCVCAM
jgi:hypothetical protein